MGYELTRDLPLEDGRDRDSRSRKMTAKTISGKKLAIVSDPARRTWHGGRTFESRSGPPRSDTSDSTATPDTHMPVEYYCKLPFDIEERITIVVDPMLATGGSSSDALTMLKDKGCRNAQADVPCRRSRGSEEGAGGSPRRRHLHRRGSTSVSTSTRTSSPVSATRETGCLERNKLLAKTYSQRFIWHFEIGYF